MLGTVGLNSLKVVVSLWAVAAASVVLFFMGARGKPTPKKDGENE
jgi:hypothetical protein